MQERIFQKAFPHTIAIAIDRSFPRVVRSVLRKVFFVFLILSFLLSFGALPLDFSYADGLFFLCLFFYLLLSFLEAFVRSMRNEGIQSRLYEAVLATKPLFGYAVSELLYVTDDIDASRALAESKIGLSIFARCGITYDDAQSFITFGRSPVVLSSLALGDESITLVDYVAALYDSDKGLQNFLSAHSVNREEFLGGAGWVGAQTERIRRTDRFWSRENLGSIPSIGTSWGFGTLGDLGEFGIPFERTVMTRDIDVESGYRAREVEQLENILERRSGANAIIIDDDESIARDIIARLVKRMKLGIASPHVELSVPIELDWGSLVASHKEKGVLEQELIKIFNEAVTLGNVVLYIRDLPGFVSSLKGLGIALPSLIAPYLASTGLHLIAHSGATDFHYFVETSPALLEGFERIIPDAGTVLASIPPLLEKAEELEREFGLYFSFAAVRAIAEGADRLITYGEMPSKAIGVLVELAPWIIARNIVIVRESDVSLFLTEKTGIAHGPVKQDEADKILHLEEILHRRIVGQNNAIDALSSALRRARSGITSATRPIASFLFLGPTGVGKTETSKALAETFFGNEQSMIRMDMSEYNGPDALMRLMGSFSENRSGLLANKIRESPYGVLLLDEFEKAAPDVLDLFLQTLDEGMFTDALGKKVNCRNLIIIATSNAGSNHIWEAIQSGRDLAGEKDAIVDQLVKERVFKPELLNRFDGVILFHPLQNTELESVARLELEKLSHRLKDQGYEFVATDDLVHFLVEKGSDPQFGARSVSRAVKDIVEDIISKKILSGQAQPGSKIEILSSDLQNTL